MGCLHWKVWRKGLLLLLSGLLCGVSPQVMADDVLEMPLESLEQLPVSVDSPFEETVIDAAAPVSVLHPDDWEKRSASNLDQALEEVPSVATYYTLGGAQAVAVRGYATDLSARGIASLLDGVPIDNYSYATADYDTPYFPLSLFSSVEMVRGPGSTLYGSDAFHGVIDMHTYDADNTPHDVTVAAGSQQQGELSWLGSTGGDGPWRANAGLALNHQGDADLAYNYTDPTTGAAGQGTRNEALRDGAAFLHLETGNAANSLWQASFYGDDLQDRSYPGIGTQFFQPLQGAAAVHSLSFSGAADTMGQNSDFWMGQLVNQRALGHGLELETRLYQWRGEQTWILDQQDLPQTLAVNTPGGPVDVPCSTSVGEAGASPLFCPHTVYQGTEDERSGLHLLLKGDSDPLRTQWALGMGRDWLKVLDASILREPVAGGAPYLEETAPFSGVARHIDYALLQARTDLWKDKLSAVYGVRLDDYSDVGQSSSPRAGLVFTPLRNWAAKLLYSHAFRAPSAAEQYGSGPGSLQEANPDIRPETLATTELVLQHQGDRENTELTFFHNHWQNAIELNPVSAGVDQYQNTGNNRAKGIELTQRLALGPWSIEANASYITSINENSGQYYSAFPNYLVNAGVGRELPQGWSLWLNERAMIDMTETDAIGNSTPLDAPNYYRTDLHLERKLARYRVSLDVRNIFDRHNIEPAVFNAEGGLPDELRGFRVTVELPY